MKIWPIIKTKILIRSLIIIILLFTCTFFFIERIVYNKMKEDAIKQILLTSEMTNIKISDIFNNTKLIAEQIETNQEVIDYIREVKTREDIVAHPLYTRVLNTLKEIESKNPHIYLAWVSNETANFCLDSSEIITDESFVANIRPWYKTATESSEAAFSQPYYEYTTNTLAISCVKAVKEDGKIIGYFSVDISLDSLPLVMKNYIIGKNGKNILLTDNKTVVFTSEDPKNKELISVTNLLSYIDSLKEKPYEEITINSKKYYLIYQMIEVNNWGIIQLIDKNEVMKPFQKTMTTVMGIFLISCILSIAILIVNVFEHRKIQQQLKNEAATDYLTGINNRKYFFENSHEAFENSKVQNKSLSVLMIDIDEFKEINDNYGHDIGDAILKKVAEVLDNALRKEDILCRLGGDEFTVLLLDTNREMAFTIANRILKSISQLRINTEKGDFSLTISIGVSFLQSEDTHFDSLLKRADQALYRAKETGRNKVSQ